MTEIRALQPLTSTPAQPAPPQTARPEPEKKVIPASDTSQLRIRFGPIPAVHGGLRQSDDGDTDKIDNVVVHYSHTRAQNNAGKQAILHGVEAGWGTLVWEPTEFMKVSAEGLLDTGFSRDGFSVGAGLALKNTLGLDFNILGKGLPIGVYVKAGPQLNYTRLHGDGSFGVGVATAAGVSIMGIDAEITRTLATNRDDYGFRLGATVKF